MTFKLTRTVQGNETVFHVHNGSFETASLRLSKTVNRDLEILGLMKNYRVVTFSHSVELQASDEIIIYKII